MDRAIAAAAPPRYRYLDALRGVAALLVVFYHIGTRVGGPMWARSGFLAVDFFFVLSGLVVASAYEGRLGRTLGWTRFARMRIERLFPLSLLGVTLGTAYLLVRWRIDPAQSDTLPLLLGATALNLLLLPKLWSGGATTDETFPGNGALWSLFLELVINFAWARFLPRVWTRTLMAVAAIGAGVFVTCALVSGTPDVGWRLQTSWGGFGRVTFGFITGVLLFRWRDRFLTKSRIIPLLAPLVIVGFVFSPAAGFAWSLAGALVAMPLAVILGLSAGSRSIFPGEALLGRISYPLYAIHFPLLMAASGLQKRFWPHAVIGPAAFLLAIPILLAAYLVLVLYDEPIRRRLGKPTARKAQADALASAEDLKLAV